VIWVVPEIIFSGMPTLSTVTTSFSKGEFRQGDLVNISDVPIVGVDIVQIPVYDIADPTKQIGVGFSGQPKLVGYEFSSSGTASDLLEVHINRSGFVSPFFLVYSLQDSSKSWIIESKGIMGKLQLREQ
jgi:hypothetical protein